MGIFSMPSAFKVGSRNGKVAHEVKGFRVSSLQWKTSGSVVVARLAVYRGKISSLLTNLQEAATLYIYTKLLCEFSITFPLTFMVYLFTVKSMIY